MEVHGSGDLGEPADRERGTDGLQLPHLGSTVARVPRPSSSQAASDRGRSIVARGRRGAQRKPFLTNVEPL